ncbi:MAG: transcription-repair coupling factor [Bacillota bacterium]|nr:transcription-repair coupling factor [Bacillota bacterium]
MSWEGVVNLVRGSEEVRRLVEGIRQGYREQSAGGLSGFTRSCVLAALYRALQEEGLATSLLVVAHNLYSAQEICDDLACLLSPEEVLLFPALEVYPQEEVVTGPELTIQRLLVLERSLSSSSGVVVVPIQALLRRLLSPEVWRRFTLELRTGSSLPLREVLARLDSMGYERVEMVEGRGQFALRGGILDVYPLTAPLPLRAEFFGDEIDSLRTFSPGSQRSLEVVSAATVGPAREVLFTPDDLARARRLLEEEGMAQEEHLRRLGRQEAASALRRRLEAHQEALAQGRAFPGIEQYLPLLYERLATLNEYFPRAAVVLDEPLRIREAAVQAEEEWAEAYTSLLERGGILPAARQIFLNWSDLLPLLRPHPLLYTSLLGRRPSELHPQQTVAFTVRTPELFYGRLERLTQELQRWSRERYRLVLAVSGDRLPHLAASLKEEGLPVRTPGSEQGAPEGKTLEPAQKRGPELLPGEITLLPAHLLGGGEFPALKLIVLTDAEVYGRKKRPHRPPVAPVEEGARIHAYTDLKVGDYVVHVNHGIGQYMGVQTLEVAGVHRDYLLIRYAGEDKLYVPTDQVHLLQKYIGVEGVPPKLYKLGGGEWHRVKSRVKASVQELADRLLRLYAERASTRGHAFSPDTVWQREFEEDFPYEETPDQLRAVEEIKRDLEKPIPMDRLLCGDVGFGKTEVALRAAFKVVMDGKQVAVLVPTTILAQQHYITFRERFSSFPAINIRVLSRFQTPSEQAKILRGLARGEVDIVIGTHRLLQKDVQFKALGLLIIDEEHKFGVEQKERLKELRTTVDVLTMTATPIPRTLHMALAGVRDISTIETPPEGRYPIRTYVVEYSEELVREAILRELHRQGQVYFVYNRVQTIERAAARLQEVVPEARVAVAHGQMEEGRLERVMLDFLAGEFDVLVCSTIIESGLDIPNVNTLIVYDADHLGLAQLYQLRGRVGRSNRVAYAYFTYRRDKILTEEAEKRLQTIKDFTELGSGFKIALRDLEIRGAGNILGPEQHGFIASVGFDLYNRLLEEAIRERKGEVKPELPQPVIDLPVDAYLPDEYVADPRQKMEIYRKIARLESREEAMDLADELVDRFGSPPEPVAALLAVARIKSLARRLGVASLSLEKNGLLPDREVVVLRFHPGLAVDRKMLFDLSRRFPGEVVPYFDRLPQLHIHYQRGEEGRLLRLLEELLEGMKELLGQTQ